MGPALLPAAIAISAGAQLYGAHQQNRAARANRRAVSSRNQQAADIILPRLSGQGDQIAGQRELSELLSTLDFGDLFGDNQAWNAGQDAWMQFLREDPYDTTELFKSWEPIEQRTLDTALADSFAQASGLGQRFGTAMMREEGRVRGEAAENAAARREQAEMAAYESTQGRRVQAAAGLQGMGGTEANAMLQFIAQMIGGYGTLGQMQGQGRSSDAALLSILFGQPIPQTGTNAFPGAIGNIGSFLMLLPMLQQLGAGGGGE